MLKKEKKLGIMIKEGKMRRKRNEQKMEDTFCDCVGDF